MSNVSEFLDAHQRLQRDHFFAIGLLLKTSTGAQVCLQDAYEYCLVHRLPFEVGREDGTDRVPPGFAVAALYTCILILGKWAAILHIPLPPPIITRRMGTGVDRRAHPLCRGCGPRDLGPPKRAGRERTGNFPGGMNHPHAFVNRDEL